MNSATLPEPAVTFLSQSALPLQSQQRLIDLKLAHLQARLNSHDLQYLDAVPSTLSR